MKKMSNMNFRKFKKAVITIEIQSLIPEKFVNLLWKNSVEIKNIRKISMTIMVMEVNLKDYKTIKCIAKRTRTKVKIVDRKGISFFILMLRKRIAFIVGTILFISMLFIMSTFIWKIDIHCEGGVNVTPYEIRQKLKGYGVTLGINKSQVDIFNIEENLIKDIDNIMWVKARLEGSKLIIKAQERQSPPEIIKDDEPCDLVAKKDGEIQRVYTINGTPVVKKGDIVKKGDVLVKGEQGNEEETEKYFVHSKGKVIAKTFFELTKEVNIYKTNKIRTGKKSKRFYINFRGKKIYFTKGANKFDKYDKIESNKFIFGKEEFYEVKEKKEKVNVDKVVNAESLKMYNKIVNQFDKSIKAVDKKINHSISGDKCKIRVLVIAEEDISKPIKIDDTIDEDKDNEDGSEKDSNQEHNNQNDDNH